MSSYKFKDMVLEISDNTIDIFNSYLQDTKSKNEAGGILLGQIKGNVVYVTKASIPTSFDKASRFGFERNKAIAQIIVNHEFVNSGGKTIYIGEWHTHPENNPTPSPQDRKMIEEQLKGNKNIEPYIFLIIQGLKTLYVSIYDGKSLYEMQRLE